MEMIKIHPFRLFSTKAKNQTVISFGTICIEILFLFFTFQYLKYYSLISLNFSSINSTKFFPKVSEIPQSNVRDGDYSICHFEEHKSFIVMCRDAEAQSRRTGEKTHFWWRGYRGVVGPNLPLITLPGMEVRLMNALAKVVDKSVPETLVSPY